VDIESFLQSCTRLIEDRLHALIPRSSDALYAALFDAARYSLFSGGKRLRPLLALASAHTFGAPLYKALDPACALECIHTYSLIHDDLPCMDNDDMRRGKPTLHRVYPEWHALLTGDYLLTYAFEMIAQSNALSDGEKVDLLFVLANRSGAHGMIGGQMIDLLSQGVTIDPAMMQQMHAHKTACLISASLECGAIVAQASPQDRTLIRECGMQIGIAFQIADDILDAVCVDEKGQKATAVSTLGHDEARRCKDTLLAEALSSLASLSVPAPYLEALFEKLVHRSH
jgi:geranylgeranyl diphosphate synthase, type II